MDKEITSSTVDCACLIHSDGYSWQYVERLYNMLSRYLRKDFRFHVYTEADRPVPSTMIKHSLTPWHNISGPKRSWWYKLQLFNPEHISGNMLYFDLDTVMVRPVSWITELDPAYFWAVRDFRYLQGNRRPLLNSSVMWFDVSKYSYVWTTAKDQDMQRLARQYHGDQDFIAATVELAKQRLMPESQIQSYRWECLDGGFDFQKRKYNAPGTGIAVADSASIIAFHGNPKPHEVQDPVVQRYWI